MKKRIKKIIIGLLLTAVIAVMTVAAVYTLRGWRLYREALEQTPLSEAVSEIQNRASYTRLEELPPIYREALLAAEDHRFESHRGVDPIGILRAVWVDVTTWSLKEGGSTLTQQLAKNMYFPMDRRPERKIAEMFLALKLERDYGKETVLDLYINTVYYGNGYYCIYDAAKGFFGKEPSELSDYECTMLVGIPNAPSVYNPVDNPRLAEERHRQVLKKMVRFGALTEEQAEEILNEKDS